MLVHEHEPLGVLGRHLQGVLDLQQAVPAVDLHHAAPRDEALERHDHAGAAREREVEEHGQRRAARCLPLQARVLLREVVLAPDRQVGVVVGVGRELLVEPLGERPGEVAAPGSREGRDDDQPVLVLGTADHELRLDVDHLVEPAGGGEQRGHPVLGALVAEGGGERRDDPEDHPVPVAEPLGQGAAAHGRDLQLGDLLAAGVPDHQVRELLEHLVPAVPADDLGAERAPELRAGQAPPGVSLSPVQRSRLGHAVLQFHLISCRARTVPRRRGCGRVRSVTRPL